MMNHVALFAKSLRLAAQQHAQQQRKSDGSPQINHLIEVVDMLVNIAHVQDENELCAAALDDSLEDTEITKEQIANELGVIECFVWLDQVAELCKNASPSQYYKYLKRRTGALPFYNFNQLIL